MRKKEKNQTQLMCIIAFISCVCFFCKPVYSNEQQLCFYQISTEDGLSHNRVHAIIQDSKGFLWIGTSDGLNRYDGINFTTFYKDDLDINSAFIISLCEDNDGNIWVGTDYGLTVYYPKIDQFKRFDKVSSSGLDIHNKVPSIQRDEEGVIWMAVNNQGLFSYDPESKLFNNYFVENGEQTLQSNIQSFYFDNNKICWLGLYFDNLYYADNQYKTLTPYSLSDGSQPFVRDNITRIIKSPYNSVYIASVNKGVSEINFSLNNVKIIVSNSEKKFITNDLLLESNRELWIGTTDGLFRYDVVTKNVTHFESSPGDLFSLSDSEILAITIDDLKGIWVGTYSSGLNHANHAYMDFQKFYKTSSFSLIGNFVRGFTEDNEGNIWIGTEKAGLVIFDPQNNILRKYENSYLPDNIYGMCYLNDNIWMGSYSGIYKLNIKTGKVKTYDRNNAESKLRDNKIYKIYKNSLNQILIGTTLGLLKYDEILDRLVPIEYFNGIFVNDILEDTKGNMWYATYADGLYKYDREKDSMINYRNDPDEPLSIPCNKILSVFEDSKNRIWLATHGAGFCLLNSDNTFTTYDFSRGITNNIIYKIIEDDNETLWISSNNGLIKFYPEKAETKIYTQVDGLLNNEFNYNSGIKINSGDILFGSKDGFIKFNPEKFTINRKIPNIVITDLYINNTLIKPNHTGSPLKYSISETRKIEVPANQNTIELKFSVLNFQSPSNNILYYKLEGYNDDWQKISPENSLFFSKLHTGKYKLLIKGVSSVGIWNETYPSIEIVVLPKFYQSRLAILLYFIFGLFSILFSIILVRKRSIANQLKRQKIFERNREIELYNEKIDFFSNIAHEIKTPLTLIRTPLEHIMNTGNFEEEVKNDLKLISHNTQHLSQLITELLDFSKIEKKGFKLSCVELDVVEKIKFQIYNYNGATKDKNIKLSFKSSSDHIFINVDEQGFVKILNNILSNALKYAETYIDVKVKVVGENIEISIKNDGQIIPLDKRESIFTPFMQYHDPGNVYMKGFGIGLSLARTLAELHSGTLVIDNDLTCNNFILTLPLLKVQSDKDSVLLEEEITDKNEFGENGKPVILLVDDKVELLNYTKRKLENHFMVITATNGKLAMEIIDKDHIDVIVSDISMPEMDGLEMCKQLKINFETCHIPVIILSAYSSMQSKIASMENGADIYIEKPFSLEYLISCIDGLLSKREKLRQVYNSEIQPKPENDGLSKRDEQFLVSLDEIIYSNMSDPEFSIEELAEHLFLSKSTLNRKMKGLLQITPNDYIRRKRLIMAAKLLKEGSNRINEVCYLVGFNTPSYFIKCFKNYYGKLPTEFIEDRIT